MNKYNKITLLVDMDDTIEDLLRAWIGCINKKYHTNVLPEEVTTWDISKSFPSIPKEKVYAPIHKNSFWKKVEPRKDAMIYLEKLFNQGFKIYLCTATNPDTVKSKFDNVVKRYFPYIDWEHIIITSKKQLIYGDILIDDGIHNLLFGRYKKILMTAPHNAWFKEETTDIVRVDNWKDAYKEIIKIANEILLKKGV